MSGVLQNFGSSVMSLFHTAPTGNQVNPAPMPGPSKVANPGQNPPGVDPKNPMIPDNPNLANAPDNTPKEPENVLDKFKDLWTPVEVDPKAAPVETIDSIFSKIDPAKIAEQAGKLDFSKSLTPELLERINKGGQDATVAMLEAMNKVGQQAFTQSTLAAINISKNAVTKANEISQRDLDKQVRSRAASEEIAQVDAMYNHPAAQPLVAALRTQFENKNPNATAAEIKNLVVDSMKALGQAFNPPKEDTPKKGKSDEMDWSSFLG